MQVLPAMGIRLTAMLSPETIQQGFIAQYTRIVVDRDRLNMIADRPIGWIRRCSTAVTHTRPPDALDDSELGIGTPESAQTERGCLKRPPRRLQVQGQSERGGTSILDRKDKSISFLCGCVAVHLFLALKLSIKNEVLKVVGSRTPDWWTGLTHELKCVHDQRFAFLQCN